MNNFKDVNTLISDIESMKNKHRYLFSVKELELLDDCIESLNNSKNNNSKIDGGLINTILKAATALMNNPELLDLLPF